jgi:hypothetical protein
MTSGPLPDRGSGPWRAGDRSQIARSSFTAVSKIVDSTLEGNAGNVFRDIRTVKPIKRIATTVVLSGGLGLAAWGLGDVVAEAMPMAPMPTYHWCPGDRWDPGWGNNWYGDGCHDDHHRDMDYDNHDHDYWGDNGPNRWGPPPPPPYWGPPPPPQPCIPFVNCPI